MDGSIARRFAALGDPTRLAIVARLARGPATVTELQQPFGISQPAISRHLKVLEAAGLIEADRAAQSRPRRLNTDALTETQDWLAGLRDLWSDSFDRLDDFLKKDPPR